MVGRARKRGLALGGAALLAALAIGVGVSRSLAGDGPTAPERGVTAGTVEGLRATLVDTETPLPAGGVAWQTRWRLCWRPVRGAKGYLLTFVTSEGVRPVPRRVDRTCYSLTVATGTGPGPGRRPGRRVQLGLIEVQLSVNVAAILRDGSSGPLSPGVSVGTTYP